MIYRRCKKLRFPIIGCPPIRIEHVIKVISPAHIILAITPFRIIIRILKRSPYYTPGFEWKFAKNVHSSISFHRHNSITPRMRWIPLRRIFSTPTTIIIWHKATYTVAGPYIILVTAIDKKGKSIFDYGSFEK